MGRAAAAVDDTVSQLGHRELPASGGEAGQELELHVAKVTIPPVTTESPPSAGPESIRLSAISWARSDFTYLPDAFSLIEPLKCVREVRKVPEVCKVTRALVTRGPLDAGRDGRCRRRPGRECPRLGQKQLAMPARSTQARVTVMLNEARQKQPAMQARSTQARVTVMLTRDGQKWVAIPNAWRRRAMSWRS